MMRRPLRIVAPFRPFPPEAPHHAALADFDWIAALHMMADSARRACGCSVVVLTDVDTRLPVHLPVLPFVTTHRRLMLWYLEIAACYLESAAFDVDTIMLDADQLIFADLAPWFVPLTDLGVLVRPHARGRLPILNGVQWWPRRGRKRLAPFYRRALALAETMPDTDVAWGADTLALQALLAPLTIGLHDRSGIRVRMIDADYVVAALSETQIRHLDAGRPWRAPARAVLDFRNYRKRYMPTIYAQAFGAGVAAGVA